MQDLRRHLPGLASGAAVVFGAFAQASATPPRLSVSRWAEANRVVSEKSGSPYPGPWSADRAPWSREIMDAMGLDSPSQQVTVRGSAQSTKSECALNAILTAIAQEPCPILVILPSKDEATKWNDKKFHCNAWATRPVADTLLPESKTAGKGSSTYSKRFGGGYLEITWAGTSKGLQMVSYRMVVAEEVAEYEMEAGERGDPLEQARARGLEFGPDFKMIVVSTTGEAGEDDLGRPRCKVTAEFQKGTREWLFCPCPHCGDFYRLTFDRLEEIDGEVGMVCPGCGAMARDHERFGMIRAGRWVATYTAKDPATDPAPPEVIPPAEIDRWAKRWKRRPAHRSFQVWRGMTATTSWTQVWEKKADVDNGLADAKVFCQQYLAEPYEPASDRPDHTVLFDARGQIVRRSGEVPPWAGFLTRSVDVQGDRVEWAVYAWGEGEVGARIAKGEILGDPLGTKVWGELKTLFETQSFSGPRTKPIRPVYTYVDSSYEAHRIYAFCRPLHGWGVRGIKGYDGKKAHEAPAVADGTRAQVKIDGRKVGTYRPMIIGIHNLKNWVYRALALGVASGKGPALPGSLLFPADATEEDFRQLTAEVLKRDDPRRAIGKYVRIGGRANEQLDLAVYARAAAEAAGLSRLQPEDWAGLLAKNLPEDAVESDLGPLEKLMTGVPDADVRRAPDPTDASQPLPEGSWRDRFRRRP